MALEHDHAVEPEVGDFAHQAALGKMLTVAGRLAREAGASDGFRTIINNGRVGHQEVYHVHMHVLGGPDPLGPMLARSLRGQA